MGQVKEREGLGKKGRKRLLTNPFLRLPLPSLLFFNSRSIFRAAKTETPVLRPIFVVPRSFFYGPKPHGNACYAGHKNSDMEVELKKQQRSLNGLDVAREGLDNLPYINRGDILTETILVLWSSLQLLE